MPHARSLGPPDPQVEVGCPYSERGGGVQCRVTGSPGGIVVMVVHGRRVWQPAPPAGGQGVPQARGPIVAAAGLWGCPLLPPVTKACGP
jgi:hypothetical protein